MAKKKQQTEAQTDEAIPRVPVSELKILIGIPSCAEDVELVKACKETWAGKPRPKNVDVVFFTGEMLGVGDSYEELPIKVQAICQWALKEQYDFLLKADSDTFIWIDRFVVSGFEQHAYSGWTGGKVAPKDEYASGGAGYCLSRKAMELIANAPLTADTCEDRWVGRVLYDAGIIVHRNILHAHGRHGEAKNHQVLTMHPCRSLWLMRQMENA